MNAVARAKPSSVKGVFIKSAAISATMGPAVRVDFGKALEQGD